MLFNSLDFAVFAVLVLGLHALLPRRIRNAFLLLASYVFYGSWSVSLLWLIVGSTAFNYVVGRTLGRVRSRALVALCVTVNLGLLAYFKYAGFFIDLASTIFPVDSALHDFAATIVLPVGISFYTFQALAYVIDVYRGAPAEQYQRHTQLAYCRHQRRYRSQPHSRFLRNIDIPKYQRLHHRRYRV